MDLVRKSEVRDQSALRLRIRVDLVVGVELARARLWTKSLDADALRERAHVTLPDMNALALQLTDQHAGAHEGVLQAQFVDTAHER